MTDWRNYLNTSEEINSSKKKKQKGPGCKRNKISKTRLGPCVFNEKDCCTFCGRPRKKQLKFDAVTKKVIKEYLE